MAWEWIGNKEPDPAPTVLSLRTFIPVGFVRHVTVALLVLGMLCPMPGWAISAGDPEPDTTKEQSADWLPLPFASYAPITKFAGGLVVGYYRPARSGHPPSNVELTLKGTQRRQVVVELEPELYLNGGQWRVQGEILGSKYPTFFYGIGGDTPAAAEEEYTARYGTVDLVAQRRFGGSLRVGPRLFARIGTITDPAADGRIDRGLVPGAEGGTHLGPGGAVLWDGRDNIYYPRTGTYVEAVAAWYSALWGSDYTFGRLKTDVRKYRSAGPGIVAGQVYGEAIVGQAPFQLLPRLGGADRMRGYREGRFRDKVYWTLQVEYRLPLFWRLKGAAFASLGEVGPRIGSALVEEVEAAVGLGGRFRFTDDGVHGRLDVAYGRTGLGLYLALGESF